MGKIMKVGEVANYLGLATETIYRKARIGEIPAIKIGRSWRFPKHLIDQWIAEKAEELRKEAKKEDG